MGRRDLFNANVPFMIPEKPPIKSRSNARAEGTIHEIRDHKDDIFFAAIENTRMPMIVTDPRQNDNPIVFANPAFISMTGYAPEEIIGYNCRFLQGPATDKDTVTAIRDALERRVQVQVEILNYRKDGSSFWNALFISPIYSPSGELVYFFASQLDVSRRRDAEEGLAQAQKMEALGQLTGGISHDFNNLLQVMSGHVEILAMKSELGTLDEAALVRGLGYLKSSIKKASTLTQQLLAFSRKQSLRGRVININSLVRDMTELVKRTLGEAVNVDYDLDQGIGNCQVDTTQLEVALLNVLVNARDAMPNGGTITIATEAVDVFDGESISMVGLPPGRFISLSITDTGHGIPAEILPRVMDPFFTTKEEGKGTGLGLSMVHGFVKQSGGSVAMDSEVGVGTTFRMYFPEAKALVRDASEINMKPLANGGSESILIVEDREEVAEIAKEMLEGLGYKVHVATNARKALEIFKSLQPLHSPELLFSDVVMPGGMNGYVLAREIQRLAPQTRILLTTGFDRDLGRVDVMASSEFELIKKPYKLADLARKVRGVLDGPTTG